MKDNENNNVKSIGYRLGQAFAVVLALCLMALIVGVTIAILCRIF